MEFIMQYYHLLNVYQINLIYYLKYLNINDELH